MAKVNEKQVEAILKEFGYKMYRAGDQKYFLQAKAKLRPMTKLPMKRALEICNPVEEKSIVAKVIASVKPEGNVGQGTTLPIAKLEITDSKVKPMTKKKTKKVNKQ